MNTTKKTLKKAMRKTIPLLLVITIAAALAGCSSPAPAPAPEPKTPVVFSYMEGVTALTAAQMMKNQPNLGREITYDMLNASDLLSTKIMTSEADIALIPSNLAATANNKDLGYKIAGTATWGNLYIAGYQELTSLDQLKGKEIHAFGRGLTPELVLTMALDKAGISTNDVTINYVGAATEIAPLLISKKAEFAVIPEPALSAALMKNPDIKVLFDLNQLWANSMDAPKGYPQASLVIKKSLIEEDPEFVAAFMKAYGDSIQWAKDNPKELGALSAELALGPPAPAVEQGILRMNLGEATIEDAYPEYQAFYKAIYDFKPDFIGGAIPDEEIFYP